VVDVADALERHEEAPEDARAAAEEAELEARPEVQAMLREMERRHHDAWIDMSLPALAGRTPREAAHDSAGRERLELLLRDMEDAGPASADDGGTEVGRLRDLLGLQRAARDVEG
jgi:hypothetical protein